MQRRSFLSLLPVVAGIVNSGYRGVVYASTKSLPVVDDQWQSYAWWPILQDLITTGHSPAEVVKYTPAQLREFGRAIGAGVN